MEYLQSIYYVTVYLMLLSAVHAVWFLFSDTCGGGGGDIKACVILKAVSALHNLKAGCVGL